MPVSRPYFPNPKEVAEAMAADLAKIGITVKLQTVDWTVYLDKRKNGELPLYMLGWTGDNGDPDNFVCYFFCMDAKDTPIKREGFVADKEVSDLLKKAASTIKQADRATMYMQAEQMIHDKVLRVFLAHNQPPLAFSKKVSGYVVEPDRHRVLQHGEHRQVGGLAEYPSVPARKSPGGRLAAGASSRGHLRSIARVALHHQAHPDADPGALRHLDAGLCFIRLIPGDAAVAMLGERATDGEHRPGAR